VRRPHGGRRSPARVRRNARRSEVVGGRSAEGRGSEAGPSSPTPPRRRGGEARRGAQEREPVYRRRLPRYRCGSAGQTLRREILESSRLPASRGRRQSASVMAGRQTADRLTRIGSRPAAANRAGRRCRSQARENDDDSSRTSRSPRPTAGKGERLRRPEATFDRPRTRQGLPQLADQKALPR